MIRLVIGGYAQGKLAYAKGLVEGQSYQILDENSRDWQTNGVVILNHLHLICKKDLETQEKHNVNAVLNMVNNYKKAEKDLIIICNELGNGVVPMTREDRDYREGVGRLLCQIAAEADVVERIFCGLPQRIK